LNSQAEAQLADLLRQQQLLNIAVTACLMGLVEIVPQGEGRGRYLDHIGAVLEGVKSFNRSCASFRSVVTGEENDEA